MDYERGHFDCSSHDTRRIKELGAVSTAVSFDPASPGIGGGAVARGYVRPCSAKRKIDLH